MEEAKRWKSKVLTLNGGNSSSMTRKANKSPIGITEKHSMFMEEKMKKEEKLSSGANTVD